MAPPSTRSAATPDVVGGGAAGARGRGGVLTWGRHPPPVVEVAVVALLAGSVLAAVHHAEVVAHHIGEPFGSLVLAVAVTIIEVSLIVTLMIAGGPDTATLARDTVFAAVMLTCNGIVGLALVIGALRRGMAVFQSEGTTGPLATVATLATLSLVLPSFTTTRPGPVFSPTQLRSPRWPPSCSTGCSSSSRRSATATTSFPHSSTPHSCTAPRTSAQPPPPSGPTPTTRGTDCGAGRPARRAGNGPPNTADAVDSVDPVEHAPPPSTRRAAASLACSWPP